MARQNINIGTVANDGTGDTIRESFNKTNQNFIECYSNTLSVESASRILYVDSINGDDANSGSEVAPVKTWAKVFDLVKTGLYINGKIKVARGSKFDPTTLPNPADVPVVGGHTPANFPMGGMACAANVADTYWKGITIEDYGEGLLPVFDLRLTLTNANITKTSNRTNIYQISFNRAQNTSNSYGKIWENDNDLIIEAYVNKSGVPANNFASLTLCLDFLDANPGSYYFDYTTSSTVCTYYFHLPDSGNPITNGKTYKARYFDWFIVGAEGNLLHDSRDAITVRNMVTIGNADHNGAIWGANMYLENVTVLEFARHGVMVHGYLKNCKVMFGGTEGGGCYHAFSEYQGQRRGTIYDGCVAVGWKNPRAKTSNIAAYYYHPQSGSTLKELRFIGCKAYNCQYAWSFQSGIEKSVMLDCEVYGCQILIYSINPIGSVRCEITFSGLKANIPASGNTSSIGEIRETRLDIYNSNIYVSATFPLTLRLSNNCELNIIGSKVVFDGAMTSGAIRLVDNSTSPTIRIIKSIIDSKFGLLKDLVLTASGTALGVNNIIIDESIIGTNISRIEGVSNIATLKATYAGLTEKLFWAESITWRGYPELNEFIPESTNIRTYSSGYGNLAFNTNGYLRYYDIPLDIMEGITLT